MLEHFIAHVVNPKKLKGQAKGMVVTQNIEAAIRYHKAISRLLEARGNPFKALIAFSGEKVIDGVEYSEAQIRPHIVLPSDSKDQSSHCGIWYSVLSQSPMPPQNIATQNHLISVHSQSRLPTRYHGNPMFGCVNAGARNFVRSQAGKRE